MKGSIYAGFSDDNGMQAEVTLAYDNKKHSYTVECEPVNGGTRINKCLQAMVEKIMAQERDEYE